MKTTFAVITGLSAGLLAAGAPAANGLVLLVGLLVGVVLTLTVQGEVAQRREDDELIAACRMAADGLRLEEVEL